MLIHLTIRNFALVSELEMQFSKGLTVITGESGAGKSILLNALGMVLGERAQRSQIHPDASQCEVYAEFDLTGIDAAVKFLQTEQLNDPDDAATCIVRRVASKDGRSRAWLNQKPVNASLLRELCSLLVGVHNQFEQRELMSSQVQLQWLNDYVAKPDLLNAVRTNYRSWQEAEECLKKTRERQEEVDSRRELLEFEVKELKDFETQPNEFEELSGRFKRLSQAQKLLSSLDTICNDLNQHGISAVGRSRTELEGLDDTSESVTASLELLESAGINLEEVVQLLVRYADLINADQESIDEISDRLDQWHNLSRKHRVSAEELHEKAHELEKELDSIQESDRELEKLASESSSRKEAFYREANKLSLLRQKSARTFAKHVVQTLADIGMKDSQFTIDFKSACNEGGVDGVNYLISTNPRYKPGPLNQIASGGELARISLAILVVVAANSAIPCLILDEADIGVGGTTADEVGRTLRKLAQHTQVVCVTHAPQVAALGSSHFRVVKKDEEGVTVEKIESEIRVEELARMLGGQEINAESRKYAAVLLDEANKN